MALSEPVRFDLWGMRVQVQVYLFVSGSNNKPVPPKGVYLCSYLLRVYLQGYTRTPGRDMGGSQMVQNYPVTV